MPHNPEILEASIVAVGNFNPAIISADWLLMHNMIGPGDAEAARANPEYIVARTVSKLRTDSIFVQVVESQLSIASTGPVAPPLKDMAVGVLKLLPHTPISAVGINFMGYFKMNSPEEYHRVGDSLAPKEIWANIFDGRYVGLLDLTMNANLGTRDAPSPNPNVKRITIQPTNRIKNGVFIRMNDHYDWASDDKPIRTGERAADVVAQNWDTTFSEALSVFAQILDRSTV